MPTLRLLITSSQSAEDNGRNQFATGTLSFSDIQNHSRYEGESFGLGASGNANGGWTGQMQNGTSSSVGYGSDSDSQNSVTQSGINTQNIRITDEAKQIQLTGKTAEESKADIYTNTTSETAQQHSGSLNNVFDKDRVQSEIDLQREVTQEFAPLMAQGIANVSEWLGNTNDYQKAQVARDYLQTELTQTTDPQKVVELTQALNQVDTYLANNQTRYQLFQEGGIGRAVLHTIGGGILTGDISGAVGAGTTSLAAPVIAKVADNSGSLKPVVDTVGGLAIGYATGGNAGAFTGANADWNNRQLHPDETRLLNKLKQGKSAEEQYRLDAAACALTRCADGVPSSDEYYKVLKDLQTAGEQFTTEKTLLQQQGAGLSNGQFNYSKTDWWEDKRRSYDRSLTKITGIGSAVAGGAEFVGSAGLAVGGCVGSAGTACVVSAGVGALGMTDGYGRTQNGINQVLTTYQSPHGEQVLTSLNVPTEYHSQLLQDAKNAGWWAVGYGVGKFGGKALNGELKGVGNSVAKNADNEANVKTVTPPSAATTQPVTSNGAANIATGAKLNLDLKTTQAANEVVESLRTTGQLPSHYITQTQAESNGWAHGKALNSTNPGKQIGGDVYINRENIVPNANGRVWYEADIGISNTVSRAKQDGTRLLYSNDGLLYISTDHYQSPAHFIGRWK